MNPILEYLLATAGLFLLVAAVTSQGRCLLAHCARVLLNGKNPLRWLLGLLCGMLPPVCWTMAFKLAKNIPPQWRPEVRKSKALKEEGLPY